MNNWKDAIVLVSYTSTKNSNGFPVEVETRTKPIPANFKSVTRAEEEHSKIMGYTAELVVEIMLCNYDKKYTHLLDYSNNKLYEIKRTFEVSSEVIELTCSDVSRKHK